MTDVIAPEYLRFVKGERQARRLAAIPGTMAEGDLSHTVTVPTKQAVELLRVAARRASGLFRPTKRTEVVWVNGDSELAVNFAGLNLQLADGIIRLLIPVRSDQTGRGTVEIVFAVGSINAPAGLYASIYRRPNGPELIVSAWSDALVAFGWQCVLSMICGIAGATGKDSRGNVLVPMARHRISGSSGLKTPLIKRS
jgi:hypothetical protein